MNDSVESILEIFRNNKKLLVLTIIAYIIVVLTVIGFIWWPEEKINLSDIAKFTPYNDSEVEQAIGKKYISKISYYFLARDRDRIYDLISSDYLLYTKITEAELMDKFSSAGLFSPSNSFEGLEVYKDGTTYIYSTKAYGKGDKPILINLVEKFPGDYHITFDSFYSYEANGYTYSNDGVELKINSKYNDINFVKYNVSIKNAEKDQLKIDFHTTNAVQIYLQDGTSYYASNLVSTEKYTSIEKGGTITKEFVFNIPIQLQSQISKIVFNSSKVNGETENITINI